MLRHILQDPETRFLVTKRHLCEDLTLLHTDCGDTNVMAVLAGDSLMYKRSASRRRKVVRREMESLVPNRYSASY